ncbi:MAG: aminotransferase class I/II-fold pyridoxal phosphate-dependent enzyme [Deltaproteobacteria bacterium]|nr:aminotransferase class I/II-fold pyridoxal phosphate-dependent enzyme [Deltaproteobacteria bacterium]
MPTIDTQSLKRLPPYLLGQLNEIKLGLRQEGADVIDLGMGNPDQPTPQHIIDKLIEVVQDRKTHRYSASRGIPGLLRAICRFYKSRFDVDLDWQSECIATIGSKEGLAHLMLALLDPGDLALVPNPTYPIHIYSVVMAGGNVVSIPLREEEEFVPDLEYITREIWPRPKVITLNFPHNPTTATVSLDFFQEIVRFAKDNNIIVVHDMAYAGITFDEYSAPSFLQVPGAKEVGVEFFTLSKSYSMPGWRVGFCVGNSHLIGALTRLKSYYDYGIFQPIQIASIIALNELQESVIEIVDIYQKRRDTLIEGLKRGGWKIEKPKATMFIWAKIPDKFSKMGSLEFSKLMLKEAKVAISPGIGFGDCGEGYVRFALVENEHRINQAVRGIRKMF